MEGVVVVEMYSGALHYTKSFSEAFNGRHPKTERLNLGALIFALQNFAGSSIRSTDNNERFEATKGLPTSGVVMFATPLENMVLATTPSNKLLVVLFTTPAFDADVAKWVVNSVAYNYENCDNAEIELMTALNQVPRRFRYAFSQAVDEAVERELMRLSESIFIAQESESEIGVDKSDDEELFVFFYYSPRLDDSASDGGNDNEAADKATRSASPDDREEECRKAVRPVNPTQSEISRSSAQNLSLRNMMASTRAIVGAHIKCESNKKKKPKKKKTRWRSRNAVLDHSEPHEFKRVIQIQCHEKKATLMKPYQAEKAYGIADVLLPFVEVSGLSLLATISNAKAAQQRPQLGQFVWKNAPGASSAKGQQAGTDMIAWRSGPCCIFYPITTGCINPENKARVRLAVTALFNVLEPLLKAKTSILV